jgi:hypothetical protein
MTYPKERTYVIIENSLVGFIGLFRSLILIRFYIDEISDKKVSKLFVGLDYLYLLLKTTIVIISYSELKKDVYDFLILTYILLTPLFSLYIMSIFYGLFREPVRQHEIQIPPPAIFAFGCETLERAPYSGCELV